MAIESANGIKATRVGDRVFLSGARPLEITAKVWVEAGETGAAPHPLEGMGFFASKSEGYVVVAPGYMRVPISTTDPYGIYTDVLSGMPGIGDPIYFTGFTPGDTGYIVLKYGRAVTTASTQGPETTAFVDFGDPGNPTYFFTQDTNIETLDGNAFVEYPPGVFTQNYAIVFEATLPPPTPDYFRRVICRVAVSETSAITLHQVHIGDILVPHGLAGKVVSIVTEPAD